MAEAAIGGLGQPAQLGGGEGLAGEQRDDPRRQLGIGQPGEAAQRRRVERRQRLWHIEPTVLGKASQQYLLEAGGGRLRPSVAGTQITHAPETIERAGLPQPARPKTPPWRVTCPATNPRSASR